MEKQKICIVGGGLTGLITAITLSKLNLKIDLITVENYRKKMKSNRTTAISQNNYDFLKKLSISKYSKKEFWPCSNMKLYTMDDKKKLNKIFEINKLNKEVLYMMDNSLIVKHMEKSIKNIKSISFKTQKKILGIKDSGLLKSIKSKNKKNSRYNLIIVCTGSGSNLSKIVSGDQSINHSYKEVAITIIVKHNFTKNNIARQIFLDNGILALLPISETKTSIVWSVKKDFVNKCINNKNLFLKKKIYSYAKIFYKKIELISDIEFSDLNFFIKQKYFQDRVLLFGDALHRVHPLAGQGFNMVLRDLVSLEKTLANKINLGLDIGSSDTLAEFSDKMKPRNFMYALGIDFIKNCFSLEKSKMKNLRNKIIIELNKNNLLKDQFFNLADKGLKF